MIIYRTSDVGCRRIYTRRWSGRRSTGWCKRTSIDFLRSSRDPAFRDGDQAAMLYLCAQIFATSTPRARLTVDFCTGWY